MEEGKKEGRKEIRRKERKYKKEYFFCCIHEKYLCKIDFFLKLST